MNIEAILNAIYIFISYFLLIIVLSSLILKPKIKDEDIFKRFIMYLIFGNIYISSIVFLLAYLNIFNRPVFIGFTLLLSTSIRIISNKKATRDYILKIKGEIFDLILGRYGFRLLVREKHNKLKTNIKRLYCEIFRGRGVEWTIFLIIIAYNIYQYGVNSMNFSTYLAPDEEVHLYWIQSLMKGNIYPSGVYPHVFHNILAALMQVFKIEAVTMVQFFSITSVIFILTTLYLGIRKIFKSKYAVLFGLAIYSVANLYIEEVTGRFQFTIPQEYAMIMLFPIIIFLFEYIRYKKKKDLIFFALALSLSVSIHFYTGIIGIILTISIVIISLYRIIKEKLLLKIILSGILSAVIALAPLATGLAMGYEMEQSMDWATQVIKGEIYTGTSDERQENIVEKDLITVEQNTLDMIKEDLVKYGFTNINIAYFFITIIVITIIVNTRLIILKKNSDIDIYKLILAFNGLLLLALMIFKALGLPTIMEPKRISIYFAYFSPIWLGMPLELLLRLFEKKYKKLIPVVSTVVAIVSLFVIVKLDYIRPISYIYYFQTSGTMKVNANIINDYDDYTWTTVSPVNNISGVLNHGYHYELSEFIRQQENWDKTKQIKIPTEYVFIYIEKRPIVDYGFRFYIDDPEVKNRPYVKHKDAYKSFKEKNGGNYIYQEERDILMAKAYYWAKEYKKCFPQEMNIYYQDSELIVYRVKQNMYALNNFNIDYKANRK